MSVFVLNLDSWKKNSLFTILIHLLNVLDSVPNTIIPKRVEEILFSCETPQKYLKAYFRLVITFAYPFEKKAKLQLTLDYPLSQTFCFSVFLFSHISILLFAVK